MPFLSRSRAVQLLRGEVGGVETLHAMLIPDFTLISDPEVRSFVAFRERRGKLLFGEEHALASFSGLWRFQPGSQSPWLSLGLVGRNGCV